jgi:hypothetical protein
MSTLKKGTPNIFKCYAKIMSFAFPIQYLDEKAVVLGQGSLSSYEDFRDFMALVSAHGIDKITVKTPLTFTTSKEAWKACRFVLDTVNRFLKNMQETVILRDSSKHQKCLLAWSSLPEQPENAVPGHAYNLSTAV